MTFCTDVDLLHWEPGVLHDAAFASQTLLNSTGTLAGTTFTLTSGSLSTSHITPNEVAVLSGALVGSYPIVSVDSDTQMTISALYDGLFPESGNAEATAVGTGTGLGIIVRTFWPQRRVISELLLQSAGLDPTEDAAIKITNPDSLRRPCALGSLHLIYSAMAAAATDPTHLLVRVDLYRQLYRRALRNARVEIDLDGDGQADTARALNVLRLQRV